MRAMITVAALLLLYSGVSAGAVEMRSGQKLDVPVCGGFIGLVCGDKDWCDYPDNAACGIGDQFGRCRPRPEFCTEIFLPVCGCNGKTYSNACVAAADGLDVAHAGVCNDEKK